ncbi:MAG: bifunctional metallophosphatase/5'-nucleotidase [Paludibacter sp.]|nr:bifunctional metallophosphatase/5'-nucleotidase [Paludibacter sp.]
MKTQYKNSGDKSNFSSPQFIPFFTGGARGWFFIIFISFLSFTAVASEKIKLVILHTNDTHSQVEPTEKSDLKTADMGGYARRMGVINKIRSEEKYVLLVDAGDFSQGSPYFNFYNGRVEIEALNRMKYDAVTLGNHEFDNGIDTLAVILKMAHFPVLSSNYKLDKTPLSDEVKPWLIVKRNGLKIGILSTNVEPKGLIIENNYNGMVYENPIEKANEISEYLKLNEKCDVIICLSHLGSDSTKRAQNDFELAHKTRYIDVIIGGHSHSMITNTTEKNAIGKSIVIAQMAKSGLYLGRVELELEKK